MATVTVANQSELETAIRSVRGGDTILLKAGTYSDLNISHSSRYNYRSHGITRSELAEYSRKDRTWPRYTWSLRDYGGIFSGGI